MHSFFTLNLLYFLDKIHLVFLYCNNALINSVMIFVIQGFVILCGSVVMHIIEIDITYRINVQYETRKHYNLFRLFTGVYRNRR